MKLVVNRTALVDALHKLSTVIPGRAVNLATFGFEFKIDNNVATITATNLTYSARTNVRLEECDGTDTFILPAYRVLSALNQMVDQTIEISRQNWREFVELKDSQFKMRMAVIAETMPDTNLDGEYDTLCTVKSNWFRQSLELVYFAAPRGSSATANPNLNGILLEVGNGEVFINAAKGAVTACRCIAMDTDENARRVVLPLPSVRVVHGIVGGEGDCDIKMSSTRLYIKSDGFELLCPLVVNPYPNVKALFARCIDSTTSVSVKVCDLSKMLERIILLQVSEKDALTMSCKLRNDKIEFSGETTAGSIDDSIPCSLDGEHLDFLFDARLLSPMIQSFTRNGSDDCTILASTGTSPVLFSSGDMKCLVMPLRG